jgi:hypothetical protein
MFWSSSYNGGLPYSRDIILSQSGIYRQGVNMTIGQSVRCLKDGPAVPFFSGRLDEVRMYNRTLTSGEAASLYQQAPRIVKISSSQNSQMTSGLVGLWSFNGADFYSGTAYDRSGSGKNGTVTGALPYSGKVGQDIKFNGTSDSVDLGNVYDGVKTVTFWVKTRMTTAFSPANWTKSGFIIPLSQLATLNNYIY